MSDLAAVESTIKQAASAFRVGMPARGNDAIVRLVTQLEQLLAAPGGEARAELLLPQFGRIVEAQERGDSLAVADLLEYELLPRL